MKATCHSDNVVRGKTQKSSDAGCRRNGKPFGDVGNEPPEKPNAPRIIILREDQTMVSPPLHTEYPKNIYTFMEMTGWVLLALSLMLATGIIGVVAATV